MSELDKNKYLVALLQFQKFGLKRLALIKRIFRDMQEVFSAPLAKLKQTGIEEKILVEFIRFRKQLEPDRVIEILQKESIFIVLPERDDYPPLLSEIADPPALLYCKGSAPIGDYPGLAVVGSRKASPYGKQAAEYVVRGLAGLRVKIISGLALGIDSIAHAAAVSNNLKTIAVIGSGLDKQSIYPRQNITLAEKIIAAQGTIISEFPPGTPPLALHFPQRNRIIAGMAHAALVIEAQKRSGALITARFALEYGRDVICIPGSIFNPGAEGTNSLIKDGAHVATSAADIINVLRLEGLPAEKSRGKIVPKTELEWKILKILTAEPLHLNELVKRLKLDTGKIMSTLIIMELNGMVKNMGNMEYIKL